MSGSEIKLNEAIANLLKQAPASDVVELLTDEQSILRLMHNNINNTRTTDITHTLSEAEATDLSTLDVGGNISPAADNNININRSI